MTSLIPAREFSYSTPDESRYRRAVIHWIEQATGKPRLRRLYEDYVNGPAVEDFFAEAVERLALAVRVHGGVTGIPRTGPLVIVANHPFGVVDGLVLGYLISLVRPDFKILVHSVLCRLPELRPHLLPIDFAETPRARTINLASRQSALKDLAEGKVIAVFPGGGVATAPKPIGQARDPEWKLFVARLIHAGRADVVPVHFAGQNSRLFQLASHLSMTLRMSLLFREVVNKIGTEVRAHVGPTIPYADLARFDDRRALVGSLRDKTEALAPAWPVRRAGGAPNRSWGGHDAIVGRLVRIGGAQSPSTSFME